jgi:capsular polysaccharide biosynthesis protein
MAAKVANAIAEVAPEQIAKFIKGSSAEVVDWATIPTAPHSPNATTGALIAAVLGAVLAAAVLCMIEILDVRIKGEEDLASISDIPVLGVIPDLTTESNKDYSYASNNTEGVGK